MLSIQENSTRMRHWFSLLLKKAKKQSPKNKAQKTKAQKTKAQKTKARKRYACRAKSGLNAEHALAVFIMRPQADVKSAPYRKNKQVARRSQTADDLARAYKNGNAPQTPRATLKEPLPAGHFRACHLPADAKLAADLLENDRHRDCIAQAIIFSIRCLTSPQTTARPASARARNR